MNRKNRSNHLFYTLLIIGGCAILGVMYQYNKSNNLPIRHLPYFGKKIFNGRDTVFHQIPDFDLVDQNGRAFKKKNLSGKIYVADYFFTTCQSICPIMKKQMGRIYKEFLSDSEVVLVSHTVNPEYDSVAVLKEYSKTLGVNQKKWIFLTGEKPKLYSLARNGYLLDAGVGSGGSDDFIHTQNFALVDKNFSIRGYYDGTDSLEVNRLINEIKLLKQEYSK